ncbi:MAG: ATP-binding protein [Spirochaetes bacterium]|nr:ATP-binding protein [Spirochaetota bacterium]
MKKTSTGSCAAGIREILIFTVLLFSLPLTLVAAVPIDESLEFKNISGEIEYIEDAGKKLAFRDVVGGALKWEKSKRNYVNFGYSKSQFWFRFTLNNKTPMTIPYLIEIDFPPIDLIELYVPDGAGGYRVRRTGDTLPFGSREIAYINYLFRILQKPGSATFYMRIDSVDSVNFNINVLSYNKFLRRLYVDMPIYWIFFGLMLIMTLYNLVLFVSTREIGYLFLACFIGTYALFEFNFKGFASQYLWPNATWWTSHANAFLVCHIIFWITLFLADFVGYKLQMIKSRRRSIRLIIAGELAIVAYAFILSIITLFINVRLGLFLTFLLALCNVTGQVAVGIYMGFFFRRPSRQARIALLAFFSFIVSIPIVILTMLGILPANFFTRWILQFGTSMAVLLLSFGMADKINTMKSRIQIGEKRYRHLVESTKDIIFTLDNAGTILSVNGSARSHIGFKPEELVNAKFLDLIQETWGKKTDIARQVAAEYISDLVSGRKQSVQFRTTLRDKYSHEAKELAVTLEYLGDKEAGYAILGKASAVIDDALTQFLETEHYTYNLNNYLTNAELMSRRLVRNLYRFANHQAVTDIRIALREVLINSIEHGNLNLSFDEKTRLQMNGNYFDLIKKRQADPVFRDKKVRVDYLLSEERVVYTITDEGEGFDYSAMLAADSGDPARLELEHGRGLIFARSAFDEVRFNDKGNQIILVKYFGTQAC